MTMKTLAHGLALLVLLEVSERFKKLGKTASASFYADKAKRLANQME